jgi:hypothetical protein
MACADSKSTLGTDAETGTTATMTTWSDGKPAFSIECELPGDCRNRAFALCAGGRYSVLKMETAAMPDYARGVPGRSSAVVRCA